MEDLCFSESLINSRFVLCVGWGRCLCDRIFGADVELAISSGTEMQKDCQRGMMEQRKRFRQKLLTGV